jgi:pilus assembly protein CpaC
LGDIPILGTLFRSTNFQNNETELVIIVTPRLVKPVPAGTLTTAADAFVPPTETDLFFYGRLEDPASGRAAGQPLGQAAGGLSGSYGHIIK